MMATTNYYEILGIDQDADQSAIKSAYRKLALKTHPDNGGDEEEFKKINEAYEVLSNPEKRQMYDSYGTIDPRSVPRDDIWSMFNNVPRNNGRRPDGPIPYRGRNIEQEISLTLEELYQKDFSKEITYERQEKCQACDNSGLKSGKKPSACKSCNGTGRFVRRSVSGNMRMEQITDCPSCMGSGQAILEEDKCDKCGGSGTVASKRTVSVNIPRGIDEGNGLVLQGQGNSGINKGPNGDLVIGILVIPHAIFRRNDNDIYLTYQISLAQAITGCSIEIPAISGEIVKVDIPSGTQHGTIFVKEGYGMQTYQGFVGDLNIEIRVNLPTKLSKEDKDQINSLKIFDSESCLVDNTNIENYIRGQKKC